MKRLKTAFFYMRGLLGLKQIGTICFAFLFSVFSTNLFASGITATATSASCNNATLETYSGTSNLQANWQANKVNLTWYSDDTQITNVQSAATTCNYDGGLTVPSSAPTKTGYTFNGWKVRGVPDGYTRLQYIQTSGTQWINTGIIPNQNSRVIVVIMATSTATNARTIGGAYGGSSWSDNTFGCYGGASSGLIYFNYKTDASTGITMQANNKYAFEIDKNKFYINGTLIKTASTSTFTAYESFRIGMLHLPFSSDRYLVGRIYSFSMWDNGTLVRELIPAKNSSNVVGMYDTVSGTFFTNAGSGTFTAGPAVQ